ncbi:hypothetical protein D3C81_2036960 [compost metagenome]
MVHQGLGLVGSTDKPAQADTDGQRQILHIFSMGHQQGDMAPGLGRHHLCHGADGRQGGEIPRHVVVQGRLQHGIRAAGA